MSDHGGRYILRDGEPVPEPNLLAWAKWIEVDGNRRLAFTEVGPDCYVSTVFLGLDHGFGITKEPVLFETMIFGGGCNEEQWRYTTREQALVGHEHAVEVARERHFSFDDQ